MGTLVVDVALSLQMAYQRSVDQASHNLANGETAGYQNQFSDYVEVPYASNGLSKRNYSFVNDTATVLDFKPGKFKTTENPLHVYISKQGGYFTVSTPDGTRYTRSGAFTIDDQNKLVTLNGDTVLSQDGGEIFLPEGESKITIGKDGTISTSQGPISQIGVTRFENEYMLHRGPDNLLSTSQTPILDNDNALIQGGYESSNVNSVEEIMRLTEFSRYFQQNQKFIESEFKLSQQANESLLRISSSA